MYYIPWTLIQVQSISTVGKGIIVWFRNENWKWSSYGGIINRLGYKVCTKNNCFKSLEVNIEELKYAYKISKI